MQFLRPVVLTFILGIAGCYSTRGAAVTPAQQTWDAMNTCAGEAKQNPLRAKCDEKFKDALITAKVRDIKLGIGSVNVNLTVSESTFGARAMTCRVKDKKFEKILAQLSPGNAVTVRGRMHSVFTSEYFTDIVLDSCELIETAPAEKRAPR